MNNQSGQEDDDESGGGGGDDGDDRQTPDQTPSGTEQTNPTNQSGGASFW